MRYYAVLCGVVMYTDSFACALPRLPSIGVWIIFTSTPLITGPAMKASLEPVSHYNGPYSIYQGILDGEKGGS